MTLSVSGMLWNRSLVMKDSETGSLWSHLLGEAMSGSLRGQTLDALPAEMTTWSAWLRQHPETTVLSISRTARQFTRDVYRRPSDFVFGWLVDGRAYSASLDVLAQTPLLNVTRGESALLICYDTESTAARLFSRKLKERTLTLIDDQPGLMRDKQTGSLWNRDSGTAVSGPLEGERLQQQVGIMSFARAWKLFHPKSESVNRSNAGGQSATKSKKSRGDS